MTLRAEKKSKSGGGLKNRFPPEVREFWESVSWHQDLWDGIYDADCLHHIKSPSSSDWKAGKHNKSILNSCPLNNFRNHIGNGEIHHINVEKELALRVLQSLQNYDYVLTEIDQKFLDEYNLIKYLKE